MPPGTCERFSSPSLRRKSRAFSLRIPGSGVFARKPAKLVVVDRLANGGVFAADGTFRVAAQGELPGAELHGIEVNETADEAFAFSENELDGFKCLHASDDAGQHSEDAALGATGDAPGVGRLGEHATITGAAEMGRKDRTLPLEPEDGTVDVRFPQEDGNVVAEIAGGEVVGSIENDVEVGGDLHRVVASEEGVEGFDGDVGIDLGKGVGSGVELASSEVALTVKDLSLEIGRIDDVRIDNADGADTGRCEVEGGGGTKSAGTDAEDLSGSELFLPLEAHFGKSQVAGVALEFIGREGAGF
jgi:hypothetical protein